MWASTTPPSSPPRAERGPIPLWLGVGGNPNSVLRAAQLGLPMATGVLGGSAIRASVNATLYRQAAEQLGNTPEQTLIMVGAPAS